MYGLKEAGKLSQLRLLSHLTSHGFYETSTPCLFHYVSRPISFVLVVDDFGIKYHHRSDFDFLVSTLSQLYYVKAHPVSSKFLGFTLAHNRSTRSLSLSYPGYISTLLTRLRPHGLSPAASPTLYTPTSYGSRALQSPTGPDISPPASPAQFKEFQVAVRYLLYYGRSVDARILTVTFALASEQAAPTLATLSRLNRLLSFVSAIRTVARSIGLPT